jgi:predicted permease
MTTSSDVDTADRLTRKRARMLPVLAVLFLSQQTAFYAGHEATAAIHDFKIAAWLVLSIVLLVLLTTGGYWFRPKNVRALMDDEVTRANRAHAFRIAFLVTMVGAILLYILDQFDPMSGRDAIHILMSIGIATALVAFGALERRALKDG